MTTKLGIRWTIGAVSAQGFEALGMSIAGAWRLFGVSANYVVCVNSVSVEYARAHTGAVPAPVVWRDATHEVPELLRSVLDGGMAEGVAWKFAPLRCFPGRFELSLDNDCILWRTPSALERWLAEPEATQRCLVAEDMRACFGRFAALCGEEPRNLGIRGLPPHFDLEAALREVLRLCPGKLNSELDEQGMQLAALSRSSPPWVVTAKEVSICSPFPPHVRELGRCGAHFCGLNAKTLPWELDGRPATEFIREHWSVRRREVREQLVR